MKEYVIDLKKLTSTDSFSEASKEELRVLLALVSENGIVENDKALAEKCSISKARALSSLVFWEEAGVIKEDKENPKHDTVRDEYAPRESLSNVIEEKSVDVAKAIKDNGLASLLSECAMLMGRPALSSSETKKIVTVYTQYALNEEYIITLAAFLAEQKKLTAVRLATDAEHLVKNGVDCVEALEIYIAKKSSQSAAELEFMRFFKVYNRPLSDVEREYAEKWFYTFGFSSEIIGLAYNITTKNKSDLKYAYLDALLTSWHEAGCKTVEECKAESEKFSADWKAGSLDFGDGARPQKKKVKEKPRYGEFDVNTAFAKALERSYGDGDTDN